LPISLGCEVEFDFIKNPSGEVVGSNYPAYARSRGWGYQRDLTAGSELRSPVWQGEIAEEVVRKAAKSFKECFKTWLQKQTKPIAPYLRGSGYHSSMGLHIHVGKGARRYLSRRECEYFLKAVWRYYPYLIYLTRNSSRYPNRYCRLIGETSTSSHYCELSFSAHGTVECRAFDSNIPQIALFLMSFLGKVAEKVFVQGYDGFGGFSYPEHKDRVRRLLESGADVQELKEVFKEFVAEFGDIELVYRSLRELAVMFFRHGITYKQFFEEGIVDYYGYFKEMVVEPKEFSKNLIGKGILRSQWEERLSRIAEEAKSVRRLSQIVGPVQLTLAEFDDSIFFTKTGKVRWKKVYAFITDIEKLRMLMRRTDRIGAKIRRKVERLIKAQTLEEALKIVHGFDDFVRIVRPDLFGEYDYSDVRVVRARDVSGAWDYLARVTGRGRREMVVDRARYYVMVTSMGAFVGYVRILWSEGRVLDHNLRPELIEIFEQYCRSQGMEVSW